MAIARITGQDVTNKAATSSVSATYPGATTAGNLLIALVYANIDFESITITGWTKASSVSSSASNEVSIFYKVASGSETTVTATESGGPNYMAIGLYEYQGFVGTPTLDKTSVNNGFGTTGNTGTTATTTTANELLLGLVGVSGVVATSPSWNNSFTGVMNVSDATALKTTFSSELVVSATGAYTTTVTFTGSSSNNAGTIATFKGVVSTGIKTVNGLTKASVKTVDGLAIASVKTINGLA